MKNQENICVPLCSVALGLAGLGLLTENVSSFMMQLCGCFSFVLLCFVTIEMICVKGSFHRIGLNPVLLGSFATYPMTLMLLSVYIVSLFGNSAAIFSEYLWLSGILFHCSVLILFTCRFVIHFNKENVYGTWFIVYVGIAMAAVTAPIHGMEKYAEPFMWFGAASFATLAPLMVRRYGKISVIPQKLRPFVCISAAPAGMILAAYLRSAADPRPQIVVLLLVLSVVLYVFAFAHMLRLIFLDFYPSHAAFTFPFVICATALKDVCGYVENGAGTLINGLTLTETVIAVVLCIVVLCRFGIFIYREYGKDKNKKLLTYDDNAESAISQ